MLHYEGVRWKLSALEGDPSLPQAEGLAAGSAAGSAARHARWHSPSRPAVCKHRVLWELGCKPLVVTCRCSGC